MEICLGLAVVYLAVVIIAIVKDWDDRRRYEAGEMTPEEARRYEQRRREAMRQSQRAYRTHCRMMRDLGMFFLLADLADGDLDGSFFLLDGDR
ncbi:MAG: hypothetical protein H5T59_03985 [Anaerolineae bacterium]|nr:hypothetical protein [Anaerolineae bacterium]